MIPTAWFPTVKVMAAGGNFCDAWDLGGLPVCLPAVGLWAPSCLVSPATGFPSCLVAVP